MDPAQLGRSLRAHSCNGTRYDHGDDACLFVRLVVNENKNQTKGHYQKITKNFRSTVTENGGKLDPCTILPRSKVHVLVCNKKKRCFA